MKKFRSVRSLHSVKMLPLIRIKKYIKPASISIHTSSRVQSIPSGRFYNFAPPPASPGSLIETYKSRVLKEYRFLQTITPKTEGGERVYTQLPDDSQFIEQHYDELRIFKKHLDDAAFGLFSADALLEKLYEFIDLSICAEKLVVRKSDQTELDSVENVFVIVDDQEVSVKRFLRFLLDVKITLNMNSNHTFILDTLLQNKELFDKVDAGIANKKKGE